MGQWQMRALQTALDIYNLCLCESEQSDRGIIAEKIIAPIWGTAKAQAFVLDRTTHQYCCDTVATFWRAAGFQLPWNLASPGRMVYGYAAYNPQAIAGPHYCVAYSASKGAHVACTVKDLHLAIGADRRKVLLPSEAQVGDCLVHWTHDDGQEDTAVGKGWGGHGMFVAAVDGTHITVTEGNSGLSMGPNREPYYSGKQGCDMTRRQGIGIRTLRKDDPWCDCVVRPSPADFEKVAVSYHMSMEAAQEAASKLI